MGLAFSSLIRCRWSGGRSLVSRLNLVKLTDVFQGLLGQLALVGLVQIVELATGMILIWSSR